MISKSTTDWSYLEEKTAKQALNRAYDREITNLIEEVKNQANKISEITDLWQIHDLLSSRRHQIDGKYDQRSESLIFVLAQLLKEGLISLDDLEGIGKDKRSKISALARM